MDKMRKDYDKLKKDRGKEKDKAGLDKSVKHKESTKKSASEKDGSPSQVGQDKEIKKVSKNPSKVPEASAKEDKKERK